MSRYASDAGRIIDYGALFGGGEFTICAEQENGCAEHASVEQLKQLQNSILIDNSFLNSQSYYAVASAQAESRGGQPMAEMSFDDYSPEEPAPLDISSLLLPPPNYACYMEPAEFVQPKVMYIKVHEPTVHRTVTLNFNIEKTVTRENSFHHQHTKTVITNVNRNHWHTQRIVVKDTNYHHYLINNQIKVNDIHHQKIENERRPIQVQKDYKQVHRIENALCQNVNNVAAATHTVAPSSSSSQTVQTTYVAAQPAQQKVVKQQQPQQAQQNVTKMPTTTTTHASRVLSSAVATATSRPTIQVQASLRPASSSSRPVSSSTRPVTSTTIRPVKSVSPRSRQQAQQQSAGANQPPKQYYYIVKKKN